MSDEINKPEPELELEQARLKRIEEEAKLTRAKQRTDAAAEDRKKLGFDGLLADAVKKTGIAWHPPLDELRAIVELKGKCRFAIQPNGHFQLVAKDSGEILDFQRTLETIAVEHKNLVKEETIQHLIAANTNRPMTKSDFKTPAAKAAFIEREGLAAWENLGLRPEPVLNPHTATASDWKLASAKQKAAVIDEFGSGIVSEILKRK